MYAAVLGNLRRSLTTTLSAFQNFTTQDREPVLCIGNNTEIYTKSNEDSEVFKLAGQTKLY
jgi:hypothetical protein